MAWISLSRIAIAYLSNAQVMWKLIDQFKDLFYFSESAGSNNLHVDRAVSRHLLRSPDIITLQTGIQDAKEFTEFMSKKTYECVDNKNELSFGSETNRLHKLLRNCVSEMKTKVGWQVPSGKQLQLEVPASVVLNPFILCFHRTQTMTVPNFSNT